MTHLAVQEVLDGRTVEWMERVTDECRPSALSNRRRKQFLTVWSSPVLVNGCGLRLIGDGAARRDLRDEPGHRVPAGVYIVRGTGSRIKGSRLLIVPHRQLCESYVNSLRCLGIEG